jgi:hypothetical protein
MATFAVDFETYYDKTLSITTMGVHAYVRHPDVEIYLVAIYGEDLQYVGPVENAPWEELDGQDFVSHNVGFDRQVFYEAKKRGLIPNIGGPRALKDACAALLDGWEVSKEYRTVAVGKRSRDFTTDEWKIINDAGLADSEGCFRLWKTHNWRWPESERLVAKLIRDASDFGCKIDEEELDRALDSLSTRLWEYENLIPWDWSSNKTPTSAKKIRAQCAKEGIPSPSSFAADCEEFSIWQDTYGEAHPWISAVSNWRKSYILQGKLQTIKSRLTEDSIFPFSLKYFGAHTGRLSGDGGFNMQNIYATSREGIDVRRLFTARPGKKLLIADYAQIEARILLWLAQDLETLEEVVNGLSVYEAHALHTMGYQKQANPMKKADPENYKLAKARVLGLGYGCGAEKFTALAWTLAELQVSLEEAKQIVADFRASNPKILEFWRSLDQKLRGAVSSKSRTLKLKLPSGRVMSYYNAASLNGGTSVQPGLAAHRTYTWGGKLTENVCQAIGRDILVDGWLKLHNRFEDPEELRVLWTVHDEFILEVDPAIDVEEVLSLLSSPPTWAPGLPVELEVGGDDGTLVEHYTK